MNEINSFAMKFFSTAPIGLDQLAKFALRTKKVFGVTSLSGEFVLNEKRSSVTAFDDLCQFFDAGLPSWSGCATIVFGSDNGCSGRCDVLKLPRANLRNRYDGVSANYRMHEFMVRLPSRVFDDGFREGQVFDYFCEVSGLLRVEFAFGTDGENIFSPSNLARGLESGLPGVYAINAYGSTFSRIFEEKFWASLSDFKVRKIKQNIAVVALNEDVANLEIEEREKKIKKLKDLIGEEYFANVEASPFGVAGGSVGLLSFIGAVIKSHVSYASENRLAKKRPVFDWSGIFSGK